MKPESIPQYPSDNQTLTEQRNYVLETLSNEQHRILADTDAFVANLPSILKDVLTKMIVGLTVLLGGLRQNFEGIAQEIEALREQRAAHLRAFMHDHGFTVAEPPKDAWWFAIISAAGLVVESATVATSLSLNGTMGIPASVGFALAFSLATTLCGLLAGRALAFARYKQKNPHKTANDLETRKFGLIGFAACNTAILAITFVSARCRVTGSASEALIFSKVGFCETFSDGLVWPMAVVTIASAFLSIYAAYAFEKYPGYRALYRYSYDETLSHMDEAGDDALDRLDGYCEGVFDRLHDIEDTIRNVDETRNDRLIAINTARRDFNARVHSEKSRLQATLDRDIRKYERVMREVVDARPDLGLEAFDDLILPLLSEDDLIGSSDDQASLSDAQNALSEAEALSGEHASQIESTLARFGAAPPDLSALTLPHGVSS